MNGQPFENFFPEEVQATDLKAEVIRWLAWRDIVGRDKGDHLLFQLDLSLVAAYFYRIGLSRRSIECLSLQAFSLGRPWSGFIDDGELAALNRRLLLGRLVKTERGHILLQYNVMAERLSEPVLNGTLDFFKRGIDVVDHEIGRRMRRGLG